ncbi:MAG TPA: SPOR domain-containing protein [Gemmatimonadales bacterium]|nr:SPOR domain-containing protein [Gemmatimonadales bacterium]
MTTTTPHRRVIMRIDRLRALLAAGAAALAFAGCRPGTSRPDFQPGPSAPSGELDLPTDVATTRLAGALLNARIPVTQIRPGDGYLATPWFDTSGQIASGRPLGQDEALVRAWLRPGRPGHTDVVVEAVYRPVADPALAERDLERPLPPDHPVSVRLRQAMRTLADAVGGTAPQEPGAQQVAAGQSSRVRAKVTSRVRERAKADTTGAANKAVPADSTPAAKPDTLPTPRPTELRQPAARVDSMNRARSDSARPPVVVTEKPAEKPVTPTPKPVTPAPKPVTPTPAPAEQRAAPVYRIQIAATRTETEANDIVASLIRRGYRPQIDHEGRFYKVRLGTYPTFAAASAALGGIRSAIAPTAFVVRVP